VRVIVAALACFVAGCAVAHDPGADAERFLADLDRETCARAVRCDGAYDLPHWSVAAWCHPAHLASAVYAGVPHGIAAGAIAFRTGLAAQCLDQLRTAPCRGGPDLASVPLLDCLTVFVGQTPLGARCDPTLRVEPCAPGAFCASSDGCEGVCVPTAPTGDTCDVRPCAADTCSFGLQHRVCGRLPALGEACTSACTGASWCVDGHCVAPMLGEGDACGARLGPCASPFVCDASAWSSGHCVAITESPLDGPCGDVVHRCARGVLCLEGRCSAYGSVGEGGACTGERDCASAFSCVLGTCRSELAPQCIAHYLSPLFISVDNCAEGACAFADDYCTRVVALHDACDPATLCADGSRCVHARCEAAAMPGGACIDDVLCPIGFRCASGTCVALPVAGEPCTDACLDADCVLGECVRRADGASCADDPPPYVNAERDRTRCEGFCSRGTCRALADEGEECGGNTYPCARGLVCVPDASDRGRCVASSCMP
jgi:hypothetical protein